MKSWIAKVMRARIAWAFKLLFSVMAAGMTVLSPQEANAVTVYDNTTVDTLFTYQYIANGYDGMGDRVTLAGSERSLTQATVEFFNLANVGGNFSATISFYDPAAPTILLGSASSNFVIGATASALEITDATFSLSNVLVPNDVVFLVTVVAPGLDLGLTVFDGPTSIGSSDGTHFIARKPANPLFFSELAPAIPNTPALGNIYLQLNATSAPVPEMPSAMLTLVGLGWFALRRFGRVPAGLG